MADSHYSSRPTDGTPILRLPQPVLAVTVPELLPEPQQLVEEYHPPQQFDDETKGNESGDDYSSGSDRSIELDDGEDGRGDFGSGGGAAEDSGSCRRRKKRNGSHGSRRHKGGSRHKHRPTFQPYPGKVELSNTLKRKSLELQEKENAAAVLRREEGQEQLVTFPVAPFNSTQFLMDEHSEGSPKGLKNNLDNSSKLTTQDITTVPVTSSPKQDGSAHLLNLFPKGDKEFSDIYSTIHAENLQSMPKEELVKHYMSLEEQVANLQKKVAEVQQQKIGDVDGKIRLEMDLDKDSVTGSDTNSLSSANEEFMDLTSVNQPTIVVGGQTNMDTSKKIS